MWDDESKDGQPSRGKSKWIKGEDIGDRGDRGERGERGEREERTEIAEREEMR